MEDLAIESSFIRSAIWHGTLDEAESIRAAHPDIATRCLPIAAILGDETAVREFLRRDPSSVHATAPPFDGDALVYLCLSKYLRRDPARSDAFVRTAALLLDAGANPNTGFWTTGPNPEFETALYGAAGVAHHAELTRLLLARGADPNDVETPYHAPETYDNRALDVLIERGRLTPDSLATMLLRKSDWHDVAGIRLLLAHGADPNRMTPWGYTALHQALRRDNALEIVETLLDQGADPLLPNQVDSRSAAAIAATRGRGDVLEAIERRGVPLAFTGWTALLAAATRHDRTAAERQLAHEPRGVQDLATRGGAALAAFAGVGNTGGVGVLLDLGVPVDARCEGDPYWGLAAESTALHVAAWRARHATVHFLLDRGASVHAVDARGRTPLARAVQACVDSHWQEHRSTASIAALLAAGASAAEIPLPTGYDEADRLLRAHRV